ncbi:TPA: hypothetical protein ACNEJR_003748 [Escherichia coli]
MPSPSNNTIPRTGPELEAWLNARYPNQWDFSTDPLDDETAAEWADLLESLH